MEVSTLECNQVAVEAVGTQTDEAEIDTEIVRLWSAQKNHAAIARKTREELMAVKLTLAERLHQMKTLLVRTGRGGRWTSYLHEHRIPRATADRYVQRHELTLAPPEPKRLSEAISAPTDEDVSRLFQKLLPQLRRVLTTQDAAFSFVIELYHNVPGVDGDVLDEGVIIFRQKQGSGSTESAQKVSPSPLRAIA